MADEILEFDLPGKKTDVIRVTYDSAGQREKQGIAADREFKSGKYFPIRVQHRNFELELLFINWDDDTKEIHPQVISGAQNIQTLHGRLRLTMKVATERPYRGKYALMFKQAYLIRGITLHAKLYGTNLESLNEISGLDVEQSLLDFGAIAVGTKSDLFGDYGPKRDETYVVFGANSYAVPIASYIFTRVIPVYRRQFA